MEKKPSKHGERDICLNMSVFYSLKFFPVLSVTKNLSDKEKCVIKVWRYTRNLTLYLRVLNLEVVLLLKMILL